MSPALVAGVDPRTNFGEASRTLRAAHERLEGSRGGGIGGNVGFSGKKRKRTPRSAALKATM